MTLIARHADPFALPRAETAARAHTQAALPPVSHEAHRTIDQRQKRAFSRRGRDGYLCRMGDCSAAPKAGKP
jgi:hypothetical protein